MSFKELKEWADDNKMVINHLAMQWVRLDIPKEEKTLVGKVIARIKWWGLNIKWRFSTIKRHITNLPRLWRLQKNCKKANQYLLKQAELTKTLGLKEPPTLEEVAEFRQWAENNGIKFAHRVQPMPRTPANSVEVSIN